MDSTKNPEIYKTHAETYRSPTEIFKKVSQKDGGLPFYLAIGQENSKSFEEIFNEISQRYNPDLQPNEEGVEKLIATTKQELINNDIMQRNYSVDMKSSLNWAESFTLLTVVSAIVFVKALYDGFHKFSNGVKDYIENHYKPNDADKYVVKEDS